MILSLCSLSLLIPISLIWCSVGLLIICLWLCVLNNNNPPLLSKSCTTSESIRNWSRDKSPQNNPPFVAPASHIHHFVRLSNQIYLKLKLLQPHSASASVVVCTSTLYTFMHSISLRTHSVLNNWNLANFHHDRTHLAKQQTLFTKTMAYLCVCSFDAQLASSGDQGSQVV